MPIGPVTRTLIGIPLDTLRKLIQGDWLQKSETICGVVGCFTTNYASGQEDIFSFQDFFNAKTQDFETTDADR